MAVQVAERWILARLRHETFFSLGALNARIHELLTALNTRPMKGYGGRTRRDLFEQFDRPALQALPAERFVHADWLQARVNIDYRSIIRPCAAGFRKRLSGSPMAAQSGL